MTTWTFSTKITISKMSTTAEISIVLRWEMFVAKYSLSGKVTSTQPNHNDKVYFGVAEKSFKDRFYNQTKSFTHEDYTNDTELSKEYWDIKRNHFTAKVTWNIVRECPPYSLSKRTCYLCLNEKLEIDHIKETTYWTKNRSQSVIKQAHKQAYVITTW